MTLNGVVALNLRLFHRIW